MSLILEAAGYRAVLAEVGASLCSLTSPQGGQLVLESDPAGIRQDARGALLAPWPNRIAQGRYRWEGKEYQLPLNEVENSNAIHGLVDWVRWQFDEIVEQDGAAQVTARHRLVPQPGYPFTLEFSVTYTLNDRGLTTGFTAKNLGHETAPYAVGAHPYLVAGSTRETEGALDEWSLSAPVSTYLEVDEHMIPLTERAVPEELDLTKNLPLRGIHLDHAFGGLTKNSAGEASVVLTADSGEATHLTVGEGIEWLQFYTDGKARRGVAIEPMTAPANAFNTGINLLTLAPGESHSCWWRISAHS